MKKYTDIYGRTCNVSDENYEVIKVNPMHMLPIGRKLRLISGVHASEKPGHHFNPAYLTLCPLTIVRALSRKSKSVGFQFMGFEKDEVRQCRKPTKKAIKKNKEIDLRTCRPGDKLRSKHGLILTYVGPCRPGDYYDHWVQYPNMPEFGPDAKGTRIHDGHVYRNPSKRLKSDHDIVEIIGR